MEEITGVRMRRKDKIHFILIGIVFSATWLWVNNWWAKEYGRSLWKTLFYWA